MKIEYEQKYRKLTCPATVEVNDDADDKANNSNGDHQ